MLRLTWRFVSPPRYRLQTVRSLAGVSLMLRLLWASLRWDDMGVKPLSAMGTTRKGKYTLTLSPSLDHSLYESVNCISLAHFLQLSFCKYVFFQAGVYAGFVPFIIL